MREIYDPDVDELKKKMDRGFNFARACGDLFLNDARPSSDPLRPAEPITRTNRRHKRARVKERG